MAGGLPFFRVNLDCFSKGIIVWGVFGGEFEFKEKLCRQFDLEGKWILKLRRL